MSKNGGKKGNNQDSKDLTRIEDLSEFLHEEDSSLDERFQNFSTDNHSLDDTNDDPPAIPVDTEAESQWPELDLSEIPNDSSEEIQEVDNFVDELESVESSEINLEADELTFNDENPSLLAEDIGETLPLTYEDLEDHEDHNAQYASPEKFEDVKTFAQNFSYGQVQGAGNPPYSIILRHIKYKDDAEHILLLLKEFALINNQDEAQTIKALEFGSLIIPQISEYCAIVLAHKLRRFDLDIEVGLSDEIHPSKEEGGNPRGLLKKENLKQNKKEYLKLEAIGNSIKDIIVSTSASIPHHSVKEYIGIQTVFTLVEESDLEKLQYVQKTKRESGPLFDYGDTSDNSPSTEKIFSDYQNSFHFIYEDLTNQLRQKALKEKANALLGVNFQLSPIQFDRSEKRVNAYQITCSATLAFVMKEVP